MTAWATHRRFAIAVALLAAAADARAESRKPTPAEIRTAARAAETAGDWEAAFAAYSHLFVADRTTPEAREKLTATLRRVQQLRRHRDPAFQQFTVNTTVADALNLFAEVVTKVPVRRPRPSKLFR